MRVKDDEAKGWTPGPGVVRFWAAMEARQREQLAERVKRLRADKSWTAEHLAHRAGVATKTISRIENGRIEDPRSSTLRKVAAALDVDPEVLTGPRRTLADLREEGEDQLDRIERKLDELLARTPEQGVFRDFLARGAAVGAAPGEPSQQPVPQREQRTGRGARGGRRA